MDSLRYVDALVKEYLLFRGFTATFDSFCVEAQEASWMSLVPEALVVVIFDELIAQQDLARLWRLMAHFSDQIYSRISTDHDDAARRVELAVFQAFLVEAVKQNRRSSVRQFFDEHAADLLASPDAAAWQRWLALPYMKHPWEHHHFKSFFSPTWQQCTRQLVLSFFATVLPETPLPTILQLQADRQAAQRCAADVAALRKENAHLHECLRASQQQHGQVAHSDADLQHEGSHSADGSGGEEGVELKDMRACSSSGSTELRISEWSPNVRMSADSEARATTSHSAPPGLAAGAASAPAPAVDSVVSGEAATGAARASGTGSARKAVHGAAGASASSRVRGAGSGAIKAAGAPAGHDRPKGGASPGAAASEEPTLCTSGAQQESPQQAGLAARGQGSSDAHAGGLEPAGRSEVRNDNGAEPLAHRERQGFVGAQRHRFHAAQPRKALPVSDSMPAEASQSRPDG